MKPKRIQLSRRKGWRMPTNTEKVDRTTKWGNPWKIGRFSSTLQREMNQADTVLRYKTECEAVMSSLRVDIVGVDSIPMFEL